VQQPPAGSLPAAQEFRKLAWRRPLWPSFENGAALHPALRRLQQIFSSGRRRFSSLAQAGYRRPAPGTCPQNALFESGKREWSRKKVEIEQEVRS
jgi:hypothetical protein